MDFDFTQEQVRCCATWRASFLARESAPQHRAPADGRPASGTASATWQQMAEMGLQGLAIDARARRPGAGRDRAGAGARRDGSHRRMPGPYFATLGAGRDGARRRRRHQSAACPNIADGAARRPRWRCSKSASRGQPSAVQMRAVRGGDEFVLSGTKRFVPWAHVADKILVVARTERRHDGRSWSTRDAAGLRQTPNLEMDHTSQDVDLVFDSVRVGRRGDRRRSTGAGT